MRLPFFHTAAGLTLGTQGALLKRPLVISVREALQHWHVLGLSGFGKSRFLAGLALALIEQGIPIILIDPHGDLAKLILSHLVARGFYNTDDGYKRLIYLDLPTADAQEQYMPFNVLAQPGRSDVVASNVLDACHRAWPELAEGAATFDTLLPDCVELLHHNSLPLTEMHQLLTDESFRGRLLERERDPALVASFRDVYDQITKKADQVQYAGSVLRRARQLTRLRVLRYGLGQREMLLNFRHLMDQGISVIVNLALPNSDARRLMGCLLTVAVEQAALSRANIAEEQRRPSILMLDEFSEFSLQSEAALKAMLSQTRKYKLWVCMAHQNWSQTSEKLRGAVQNVGWSVAFNLGADDAAHQAKIVGHIDPTQVKHQVEDESAAARSHPSFLSVQEQMELQAQHFKDQWPQEATVSYNAISRLRKLLKRPLRRTLKITVTSVPNASPDPVKLAEVEANYLRWCFVPREQIERQQAEYLAELLPASKPCRRSRVASSD